MEKSKIITIIILVIIFSIIIGTSINSYTKGNFLAVQICDKAAKIDYDFQDSKCIFEAGRPSICVCEQLECKEHSCEPIKIIEFRLK